MPKIDTTKIAGYADMSVEEKLKALESYTYEDNNNELEALRRAKDKAASDAADWKRKYQEQLSDDEKKKQEAVEEVENLRKELAEVKQERTLANHKAKFVSQGYSDELADKAAKALVEGDTEGLFAAQKTFLEDFSKRAAAEAMKGTPKPGGGGGDDHGGVDYAKKYDEARASGNMSEMAYYQRMIAEAEAGKSE